MSHDKGHFNPEKIFILLFIMTALEVAWGLILRDAGKLVLWGGLGFFAFIKAWYIAVYFMHLRFEGWVVKSLILPTPFLIMVIYGYVSPDISRNEQLDHPIGAMWSVEESRVLDVMPNPHDGDHDGDGHADGEADGHDEDDHGHEHVDGDEH